MPHLGVGRCYAVPTRAMVLSIRASVWSIRALVLSWQRFCMHDPLRCCVETCVRIFDWRIFCCWKICSEDFSWLGVLSSYE